MALLAGTHYDPAVAATKATTAALAMTAIDTSNLRLTFTAPTNGKVLVRIRCCVHGATTYPQILLGVLDGATIKGRQSPVGALKTTAVNTAQLTQEALFSVTGLTPGNSYTWDAAYGVETAVASTGIKYGGPDDTTTNNQFGGISYEIWSAPNLLASTLYDPTTAVAKSTSALLIQTALDTTNLRLTFTAPSSGNVEVRLRTNISGATTMPTISLSVMSGSVVMGRQSPLGGLPGTAVATTNVTQEAQFIVTGLSAGTSYTWDAAYGVDIVLAATKINYGGPDDASANNAWGGFLFEIWQA